MTSAWNFSGRNAWVTGAGQGIGLQVAQQLTALGADVTGFDLAFNQPAAEYAFRRQSIDLTCDDEVQACVADQLQQGVPDILINAAGILRLGDLASLTLADWDACFAVNTRAVFSMIRAVSPAMKQQQRGSIVTVSSNAAHVPRLNMAAYCASKAAVRSFAQCAALELAPFKVRCNLVSPGSTDTPMLRAMLPDGYARTIEGLPQQYKLGIPLAKVATPADIANAVIFLASDLAGHITMHDLVVDGGATLAA